MKMLFFSSDVTEVQVVNQAIAQAGIPCLVRQGVQPKPLRRDPPEAELWIRNDKDSHRALMICVELGLGFSRRPVQTEPVEIESETAEPDHPADIAA
jgi:hypothetical protein